MEANHRGETKRKGDHHRCKQWKGGVNRSRRPKRKNPVCCTKKPQLRAGCEEKGGGVIGVTGTKALACSPLSPSTTAKSWSGVLRGSTLH